jgi:antirestriction protein ArdC
LRATWAAKWGDEGYAREELVAELGSAFLAADIGITPEVREDRAAYIATWLILWGAAHNSSNREVAIM